MRLAFVDLETTGATAQADRITEIGIVQVDESGVSEWSSLVNPQAPITGFVERLTGISNAMVATAPVFGDLAAAVLARLEGCLFIAHNARFDYGFLRGEFARAGIDFRATVLCTVNLSRRLYPDQRKHSLDSLIERHGLRVDGRHRALADARLIHQFWNLARADKGEAAFAAAIAALTAQPRLPPQLDPGLAAELPDAPGVYVFYGEGDLPLYVGKGKSIRDKVLGHFAGDGESARNADLARRLRRVDWQIVAGDIAAALREIALVGKLRPEHNRRRRDQDAPAARPWPFPGPACIREGAVAHLFNAWRYLGTAGDETALAELLAAPAPAFDADVQRLLLRQLRRLAPVDRRRD